MSQNLNNVYNKVVAIDKNIVLDWLPIAEGVAFDSHAEEHNPTCLQGTRVDLLHEISKWVGDPDAKAVFWLNGMAGTGKSTISRTLAQSSSDCGQLGASFFFKRGESDRGSASKFFTTIAAQLIRREPALAVHVKNAINADPAICNKAIREQFDKLIFKPLSYVQNTNTLVIVIDALDECDRDEDVRLIIYLLSRTNASNLPRLRVFLTSRPELPIRLGFHNVKGTYQGLILHEIQHPVIAQDLSIYFVHELAKIREEYNSASERQLPPTWPRQSDIRILINMAVPLFIFAATACRFIADLRNDSPDTKLRKFLAYQTTSHRSQLNAIYLPVLDQLLTSLSSEDQGKVLARFRRFVGSIVLLANPLSTSALAYLLNVNKNEIDSQLISLHSVLSIPSSSNSPVRLLHLSFRDFLINRSKRGKNLFWIDEKETHKQLAADCLRVIDEALCADMCQVRWPGTAHISINPQTISDKLPPGVQYACQYWAYHVQQAGDIITDNGQVHCFLRQHFLHWLEALSLIGRVSESLKNIRILQSLLQVWPYLVLHIYVT